MPDFAGISPKKIEQAGADALRIEWSDGHASLYPVAYLRRSCRCASCVDEWTGAPILDPKKVPGDVRPVRIDPVGRYAIGIVWTDGHSTGIYTWEHLRSICICPECRRGAERPAATSPPSAP